MSRIVIKKLCGLSPRSELYRPSNHRFSAKLQLTFADRGCHVVRVTDPYGRILGFLDRTRIVIVILIYHRHKPIDSINLLGS
jgi:hypothetical protein